MDNEILYCSIRQDGTPVYIDYYIIPESISADYCDLKYYGIKIQKTALHDGGGKTIEIQQINNVFYRRHDASAFLDEAVLHKIEPRDLRVFVENYISEGIYKYKHAKFAEM